MECKNSRGHVVLPILYKVTRDVERQLGMLGERFWSRKKCLDEKVVDEWEEVCTEITSLDSKKDVNRFQEHLAKLVIIKVLSELQKAFELVFTEQLVGINEPIRCVMILVYCNSSTTLLVLWNGWYWQDTFH